MTHHAYWRSVAVQITTPVLAAMANDRLVADLPMRSPDREEYKALEATARVLSGIAPWLQHDDDIEASTLRQLAVDALHVGLASESACRFRFHRDLSSSSHNPHQGLVDAAFLALALFRAPCLWEALSMEDRAALLEGFRQTRVHRTVSSNWLLFAAMVEAFVATYSPADAVVDRIDRAFTAFSDWYLGDGVYGDGPEFHNDYYNSYVIHPFLVDLCLATQGWDATWDARHKAIFTRAERYAVSLERLISPEGTFPPLGRSITYRFGALHHLALMAYRERLPESLAPEAVQCAMTAVLRRFCAGPLLDSRGWLEVGFMGTNVANVDSYIAPASLYGFCWGFLPLGLKAEHRFWSSDDVPWTAKRAWGGQPFAQDNH